MFRNVCVSLLLVCLLAGCGDSSNPIETVAGGAVDGQAASPSVLQGRVEIGGQAVPAVEVRLRHRGRVVATATSDGGGQFQFDLDGLAPTDPRAQVGQTAELPNDLLATVGGVDYTAVITDLAGFIYVSEISTLIHDYLEDHPGDSLESAQAAVGSALGCPPDDSVATLSDSDIFDPATFQKVAQENGGGQAFLSSVVEGIDHGDFDFGLPDPYGLPDYGHDQHQRVAQAGGHQVAELAGSLLAGTAKSIAVGVLGEIGARGFGWVISSLSSNTDPSLDDVVGQLDTLQSSVDSLRNELNGQFAGQDWNTAIQPLLVHSRVLDSYVQRLATSLELRGNEPADEPAPQLPFVEGFLTQNQFGYDSAEIIIRDFLGGMLAPPGAIDTVQSYHRRVMASLGRANPDERLARYDLRRNDLTLQLERNLAFQLSQVEVATEMLSNAAHNSFLDASRPGNLLPAAITNARILVARGAPNLPDVGNRFQRAKQLVPDELPRDDVMVLPPTVSAVVDGTPTLLSSKVWTIGPTHPNVFLDFDARRNAFLTATFQGDATWGDTENWRIPTLQQYVELDRLATEMGAGDARLGLRRMGLMDPDDTRTELPGFTYQGAHQLYRFFGRGHALTGNRRRIEAVELDVYIFSRPGRAGHVYRARMESERGPANFLGSLFVRGSLSGNTPKQFETLFATGTTVAPTSVSVRREENFQLSATASYQFPSGQRFDIDVTDRVAWQSNNPAAVEVSNFDDEDLPFGALTLSNPGTARVEALLLADPGQVNARAGYVVGGIDVLSAEGLVVHELMITPRNSVFTSIGDPVAHFSCTGLSRHISPKNRDTHVATDLTNNPRLTWRLLGPDGAVVDSSRARISSATSGPNPVRVGGILRINDPNLATGIYRVQATLTGTFREQVQTAMTTETKILLQLR